jgi:hypothetical protein
LVALLLCGASQNDGVIPINKNLCYVLSAPFGRWSSLNAVAVHRSVSFICCLACFGALFLCWVPLLTALDRCAALIALSFFYWIIDVKKLWNGGPW